MAIDIGHQVQHARGEFRRWGQGIERLDFLITTFAFCWLLARFFVFALRRFRW